MSDPDLFRLDGRTAVVTGAGQNVGEGVASVFAARGAHVLVNDIDGERAERVAARTRDLIELQPPARDAGLGTVAVHDACHHLHAQGIGPRGLLAGAGAHCVDLGDGGRCCGAAGLYSVLQPEMAAQLRRQKAEAVAATGAPVVAVANPGCAIQIAAGLRELGSAVRVAHPAELISPE